MTILRKTVVKSFMYVHRFKIVLLSFAEKHAIREAGQSTLRQRSVEASKTSARKQRERERVTTKPPTSSAVSTRSQSYVAVSPQEATSASLSVDDEFREQLRARKERAKEDFLRDHGGDAEAAAAGPEVNPERDPPEAKPEPNSTARRKRVVPRAYNSALAGKVALEREARARLPPPRGDCAVVEVSFTPRQSRAPKRDTKVRFRSAASRWLVGDFLRFIHSSISIHASVQILVNTVRAARLALECISINFSHLDAWFP